MTTTSPPSPPAKTSSNPLFALGVWWDGVIDRYNALPKPLKVLLVALFALFVFALPPVVRPVRASAFPRL